jgi:hypothetical protein
VAGVCEHDNEPSYPTSPKCLQAIPLLSWFHCCHDLIVVVIALLSRSYCGIDSIVVVITLLSRSQCLTYRRSIGEISWFGLEPCTINKLSWGCLWNGIICCVCQSFQRRPVWEKEGVTDEQANFCDFIYILIKYQCNIKKEQTAVDNEWSPRLLFGLGLANHSTSELLTLRNFWQPRNWSYLRAPLVNVKWKDSFSEMLDLRVTQGRGRVAPAPASC